MINRTIRDAAVFLAIAGLIYGVFSAQGNVYAEVVQQSEYAGRLDAFLQAQMKTYRIPGLAVAIIRDGEVEYSNGYGTANAQGGPVTPDTPFLLASLSKSFTALGVMQLVAMRLPVVDHAAERPKRLARFLPGVRENPEELLNLSRRSEPFDNGSLFRSKEDSVSIL